MQCRYTAACHTIIAALKHKIPMNSVINNENPSFAASLDNIFRLSKNSRLSPSSFQKMKPDLENVASFIQCSEIQALLFAVIFGKNFESYNVSIRDLAEHLKCTPTKYESKSFYLISGYSETISKAGVSIRVIRRTLSILQIVSNVRFSLPLIILLICCGETFI